MTWFYNNKEFTSDDIGDYIGFVYIITDTTNGKKYVGKKGFWSIRKLAPLKGQKRKRTKTTESDWMDYFGSSEEVKLLVEQSGRDRFRREILHLCKSKGEMSYMECYYQMTYHVLLRPDEFYNSFVGLKVHRKHLMKMTYNDVKNIRVF